MLDQKKYSFIPQKNQDKISILEEKIRNLSNITTNIKSSNCKSYSDRLETVQSIVNKNLDQYNNLTAQLEQKKIVLDQLKTSLNDVKLGLSALPMEIKLLTE